MAVEAFLVIPNASVSPAVVGETVTDRYFASTFPKAVVISLSSFAFGLENATSVGSATSGAGSGKATFQALSVRKAIDNSSPSLFSVATTGRHFSSVQLYLRQSGSSTGKPFLGVEFQTVFVSKLDWSGAFGDDAPAEELTLAYGAMAISYRTTNPDGSLAANPNRTSWNVITNTANVTDTLT